MTRPGTSLHLGLEHHPDADQEAFDARRTGLDHLAFALGSREELHDWVGHLDALEVDRDPVVETTHPAPMALVTFRDPDGIPLEMMWFGG